MWPGNYDQWMYQSIVDMKNLHGVGPLNKLVHLSSKRGGPVTYVLKAGDLIDDFAPKVKLQFDDIFVSTQSY